MSHPAPRKLNRIAASAVLLMSLLIAAAAYSPGLDGGFMFDDYTNIVFNDALRLESLSFKALAQAGWSGMAGPLKRPLAMVSYALNYSLSGDSARAFKLTNLAIHLINGGLLFALLRLLLFAHADGVGRRGLNLSLLSAVATAIWLVHPINLTSVLYVVQRMTSLAAMFSLAAMICYCAGRFRLARNAPYGWWLICLGVPVFTTLGVLSKENAILTIPLVVLIELCFFRLRAHHVTQRTLLRILFIVAFALPTIGVLGYLLVNPEFLTSSFAGRRFTLSERLLTEARVIWFYLSLLLLPRLNRFGLHHDDYTLSTSFIDPITTTIAVGGIAGIVVVAVIAVWRYPLITFSIGWFLIAHVLESSVIALELVHEHRNYLPTMGIVLGLTYFIARLMHSRLSPWIRSSLTVGIIVLCATLTFVRAGHWGDPTTLALVEVERHPKSSRAVYEFGRIQYELFERSGNEQDYQNALVTLELAATLNASAKRPLATLLRLEHSRARTPNPAWMVELLHRYKNALFHPSDTRDLHELVSCRAERKCLFPQDDILALFDAALSNPTLRKYSKAQLSVDLAMYHVNETGDLVRAMTLLDDSARLFPTEFGFRKLRAQLYIMSGRYDEVEREIDAMRSVNVWRDELFAPLAAIDQIERAVTVARSSDRDLIED